MFPAVPKQVFTRQGAWLRSMAKVFMVLDFAFFVFTLALVGFQPMILNLVLGVLGYSLYLTLREWIVILYCICKVGAAFSLIFGGQSSNSSYSQ